MKLSALFASIDSNAARNSANVCFRSVHTSLLGSIVNQLVRDFHQDNLVKPRDETDEKLAGLKSLELIAELEAKEKAVDMETTGSPYSNPINTTLTLDQKFCIMKVVETSAKRTAAVGNRFERPMERLDRQKCDQPRKHGQQGAPHAQSFICANTSRAAATVASMSASVWAALTKPASYSAGAM